jgi:hypothetical protein
VGTGIAQNPVAYKLRDKMGTLIRVLILAVLVAIVASLGSALFHLSRGAEADSAKMARALTIRITLSLALFALLIIAWYMGLISPHTVQSAAPNSP